MNPWNSFLQTVFQFVKSLFGGVTKKMHRNAAVLTMGATLIAVIPFTAVDFQGGGKNAIVAYAETQGGSDEDSLEETEDTALPETDGNVLEDETTADEASSAEDARPVAVLIAMQKPDASLVSGSTRHSCPRSSPDRRS